MKNILNIGAEAEELLANIHAEGNTLLINDEEIDPSLWIGSGTYTATVNGHTISIQKAADNSQNLMLKKVSDFTYKFLAVTKEGVYTLSKSGSTITLTGSDGTTSSVTDDDTTYTAATTSKAGLMSAADKTKLNAIGDIEGAVNGSTAIENKSVAGDSTVVNLGSFTLPAGLWIVKVHVRYNANSTGNRTINISASSGGDAYSVWNTIKVPASATSYTHVALVTFLKVESGSKTFYVNTQQNSGSAITCATRYGAIKISD